MLRRDDRFVLPEGPPPSFPLPLVNGYEVTTITPVGNPYKIDWGQDYSWSIGNIPFFFGNYNTIRFRVSFTRRLKGDTTWVACKGDEDSRYICLNPCWTHSFVQRDAWRAGLREFKTDGFAGTRGRLLHEVFSMGMTDEKYRETYSRVPFDWPMESSINKNHYTPAHIEYKNWLSERLSGEFDVYYSPLRMPFRYRHVASSRDKIFPNVGESMSYDITLVDDPRETFYLKKTIIDGEAKPSDYVYSFNIHKMEMLIMTPRVSIHGMNRLRDRTMAPYRYESDYVVQYVIQIDDNMVERVFTLSKIALPEYMLIFLVKDYVFARISLNEDENMTRELTEFQPLNIDTIKMTYGGKDLSTKTANFDIQDKESILLRDKILKNSNIFGCPSHNKNFYLTDPKSAENFKFPHYLFSFCSNEATQDKLDVVDANQPKNEPRSLEMTIKAPFKTDLEINADPKSNKLTEGKLVVELIYKNRDILYDMKDGTIIPQDLRSLISSTT